MVFLVAFFGLGLMGMIFASTAALMIFMFTPFVVLGIYIVVDNYKRKKVERKQQQRAINNPRSVMYGVQKKSVMPKVIALAVVGGLIGLFVGFALVAN